MSILLSYDFLIVAIGTMLLGGVSSIFGCYMLQLRKSLISDAIGHASYPGVLVAFILFQQRNSFLLIIGSAMMGLLAFYTITFIQNQSVIDPDVALALILTGFFGLGMVLKTFIQGNPMFMNASQAGLQTYIFGMASYISRKDIWIMGVFIIPILVWFVLSYQSYKIYIFDRHYAEIIGLPVKRYDLMLVFVMIVLISIGIKMVGSILIASYFIIPAIFAHVHCFQWHMVLSKACGCAIIASLVGTWISTAYSGFSTGATMVLCMGTMTIVWIILLRIWREK